MTKRKFYKTVITLEVISEEPLGDMAMEEIVYEITVGDCSGKHETIIQDKKINGKEAAKVLIKHGSDPEFFGIDEKGNDF